MESLHPTSVWVDDIAKQQRDLLLLMLKSMGCTPSAGSRVDIAFQEYGAPAPVTAQWRVALVRDGETDDLFHCVRQGADDILLLPPLLEELHTVVKRAEQAIAEKKRKQMQREQQVDRLEEQKRLVIHTLLRELESGCRIQSAELYQQLLGLPAGQCYVLLCRTAQQVGTVDLAGAVASFLQQRGVTALTGEREELLVILVFNPSPLEAKLGEMNRDTLAGYVQEFLQAKHHFHAELGKGRLCDGLEELSDSWVDALAEITPVTFRVPPAQVRKQYSVIEERLCDHLLQGKTEQAEEHAGELCRLAAADTDLWSAKQQVLETIGVINYLLRRADTLEDLAVPTARLAPRLQEIHSPGGLQAWLVALVRVLCENIRTQNLPGGEPIKQAVAYIHKHYNENVTLDSVAKYVNLSPYYFSKLFKQHCRENFIDYLTQVRMSRAVELLADRACTVQEVCYAVGYTDPNYFSKLFKNYYGVSPSRLYKYVSK